MKKFPFFSTIIIVAVVFISTCAYSNNAYADTIIDTTSSSTYRFTCLGISSGCGQTFGQTFSVGSDTTLNSFAFGMVPVQGGSLDVVFKIFQWDGSNIFGSALYQSGVTTLTNTTYSLVTWTPDINLTNGGTYMALLDTAGIGNSAPQFSGIFVSLTNPYSGGAFGWERTSGDGVWNVITYGYDAAFVADFVSATPVPAPATLTLFASGLIGLGLLRRRSRSKKKAATLAAV